MRVVARSRKRPATNTRRAAAAPRHSVPGAAPRKAAHAEDNLSENKAQPGDLICYET